MLYIPYSTPLAQDIYSFEILTSSLAFGLPSSLALQVTTAPWSCVLECRLPTVPEDEEESGDVSDSATQLQPCASGSPGDQQGTAECCICCMLHT